jgi:hypothetical protein
MEGPRKLRSTTMFLGKDQWAAACALGKAAGYKRGGSVVVRAALDEYLERNPVPAKVEPVRRAAK